MKKILILPLLVLSLFLVACQEDLTKNIEVTYISGTDVLFTDTVESNNLFLPSQKPTKANYEFGGWYLDQDFLYPAPFGSGVNENITLYAKWNLIDDTAPFDMITWLTNNKEAVLDILALENAGYTTEQILELVDIAQKKLIEKAHQSVVKIDITGGANVDSGGSGVIYQKLGNTYYVITNEHVTSGTQSSDFEITVFTKTGTKSYTSVTKVSETYAKDLAILKFTTTDQLEVMPLANDDVIKNGGIVFALGSPVWFDDIVTQGVISYNKLNDDDGEGFNADVIMHSAPMNPGNSGGALINVYGQLVGINAYSYPTYDTENDLQMYNFAIHISEVKAYIQGKS
ncbi:trypsin-like peptidase domain-containing protein [Acholeplasma granularum]|uniref:trypsin-like peptidase domain-containing protein n=1 Tax=Acholeplasma granularum TaxID=264635 RepID=UPI00046EB4B6|nr:trypsin-like peptidase domain-containing protein [Acholeplasma granularum]